MACGGGEGGATSALESEVRWLRALVGRLLDDAQGLARGGQCVQCWCGAWCFVSTVAGASFGGAGPDTITYGRCGRSGFGGGYSGSNTGSSISGGTADVVACNGARGGTPGTIPPDGQLELRCDGPGEASVTGSNAGSSISGGTADVFACNDARGGKFGTTPPDGSEATVRGSLCEFVVNTCDDVKNTQDGAWQSSSAGGRGPGNDREEPEAATAEVVSLVAAACRIQAWARGFIAQKGYRHFLSSGRPLMRAGSTGAAAPVHRKKRQTGTRAWAIAARVVSQGGYKTLCPDIHALFERCVVGGGTGCAQ